MDECPFQEWTIDTPRSCYHHYNIFKKVNMSSGNAEKRTGRLLRTLGQPVRLQILLAIGRGEACVCHLVAISGLRQALISQHLMALRRAGVLQSRRDGRFIYYRLRDPAILDLVELSSKVAGVEERVWRPEIGQSYAAGCGCPSCTAAAA
jgi:DNA-binding transcriptional ArsR family regulator